MSREDAQLKLRLPEGLRDRVKAYADNHGRSMNAEIVRVLQREFPEPSPIETRVDELLDLLKVLKAGASNKAVDRLITEVHETIKGMIGGSVTGLDDVQRALVKSQLDSFDEVRDSQRNESFVANLDQDEIVSLNQNGNTEKSNSPFPLRR